MRDGMVVQLVMSAMIMNEVRAHYEGHQGEESFTTYLRRWVSISRL